MVQTLPVRWAENFELKHDAKRKRLSNKEYARLRQRADEEARARNESADRQERIKILWQELRKKSDRAKEL
jgi:hypothetical protein